MSIETDARQEAERVEQSNDIACTVIEVAQNKTPSEFVTPDFRYGIADALWDAGYRKVEQDTREPSADPCPEWQCPDLSSEDRREGNTCPDHPCTCPREPSDEEVEAAAKSIAKDDGQRIDVVPEWVEPYKPIARAALLAAQEVRNRG